MALTSLLYDKESTILDETVSMKPGIYHLNPPVITTTPYQTNPSVRLQKIGNSISNSSDWRFYAGPIDQESDLFDITRPASNCPHNKYQPLCPDCYCLNNGTYCGEGVIGGCNTSTPVCAKSLADMPDFDFKVEYTRLTSPLCALKEVQQPRFEFPLHNPQNDVFFLGRENLDTRSLIKDNFTSNIKCAKVRRF